MQVDLRPVAQNARLSTVLPLFEQLPRGQGLTLISDQGELEVLEFLQQQHAGEFDWYQLETGPGRWLLVLSRRPAGVSRHRQVLEFMEADHRHIHELLADLDRAARRGERDGIVEHARHLQTALGRHIKVEEEVLLPIIAERLGSPRGPAAVLRDEHIQIDAMVKRLVEGRETAAVLSEICASLNRMLQHHSGMEERILYAVTDLLLSESERDELVRRCQRI
jgi:uncharacterized protein (DUF2249 family)